MPSVKRNEHLGNAIYAKYSEDINITILKENRILP
jgi:hypothetical protein